MDLSDEPVRRRSFPKPPLPELLRAAAPSACVLEDVAAPGSPLVPGAGSTHPCRIHKARGAARQKTSRLPRLAEPWRVGEEGEQARRSSPLRAREDVDGDGEGGAFRGSGSERCRAGSAGASFRWRRGPARCCPVLARVPYIAGGRLCRCSTSPRRRTCPNRARGRERRKILK